MFYGEMKEMVDVVVKIISLFFLFLFLFTFVQFDNGLLKLDVLNCNVECTAILRFV